MEGTQKREMKKQKSQESIQPALTTIHYGTYKSY